MFGLIDNFLNRITMYRLVFYSLLVLLGIACILGFFNKIPYSPLEIASSTIFLLAVAVIGNFIFSKTFGAPVNIESTYITSLILALICKPASSTSGFIFLFWAALLAIGSKFIIAPGKKHIFNPAAFAVALTAITLNQSAIWWIGTAWMMPFVIVASFLIIRKIKRADLAFSFIFVTLATILIFGITKHSSTSTLAKQALVDTPLWFFAGVMLTEPLTTPPTKGLQIWYGALVGFLFAPQTHFGSYYFTPEVALIVGNIFSYLVSPKQKLLLKLKEKIRLTPNTYDFVFQPIAKSMPYEPGQYMEWTLGHKKPDNRGVRRYFTISSAPTEQELRIGVKFYSPTSTFKKNLYDMQPGDTIVANQLAGDFVLPKDPAKKLVFIAGGIGITPFRSMLKYLLDTSQSRPVTIFYANRTLDEIAYIDILDAANKKLGIKTIYALTDKTKVPDGWRGHVGQIDQDLIRRSVPDFAQRTFMISGPRSMIVSFEKILAELGVPKGQIKTDYFPGFA